MLGRLRRGSSIQHALRLGDQLLRGGRQQFLVLGNGSAAGFNGSAAGSGYRDDGADDRNDGDDGRGAGASAQGGGVRLGRLLTLLGMPQFGEALFLFGCQFLIFGVPAGG